MIKTSWCFLRQLCVSERMVAVFVPVGLFAAILGGAFGGHTPARDTRILIAILMLTPLVALMIWVITGPSLGGAFATIMLGLAVAGIVGWLIAAPLAAVCSLWCLLARRRLRRHDPAGVAGFSNE